LCGDAQQIQIELHVLIQRRNPLEGKKSKGEEWKEKERKHM
jgi:hypothetical protein